VNSTQLYALFRADTTDNVAPYLWTDVEVFSYMNDAYTMFVRRIGGIPDYYNDEVCLVQATKNVEYSPLHPKILFIRAAHLEPKGETVKVVNMQDEPFMQDEDYGLIRQFTTMQTVGKVKYLVIGVQDDIAKWVSVPDVNYQVRLLVERLPLGNIDGLNQEFDDVKDHHHLYLLCWMKYLAYSKQDAETFDKVKAAEEQQKFLAYCLAARQEKEQYKHKVRVVRYGGI
jgi:hypothetical protein